MFPRAAVQRLQRPLSALQQRPLSPMPGSLNASLHRLPGVLNQHTQRHFSNTPAQHSIRSSFAAADKDPNWESINRCKSGPACPDRADDLIGPVKNHAHPYQQAWCDNQSEPLPRPMYVPRECCVKEPPRRPRKVPGTSAGMCGAVEAKCMQPEIDRCVKILAAGCAKARIPTTCVRITLPVLCKPVAPPTPSFHECLKDPVPPLPPDECHCFEKQPPCIPTRKALADR